MFVIDEASPYEFNDSVLDTQGWNSSRYDGRQLQASEINEFTEGDTSYFGTPVLQKSALDRYVRECYAIEQARLYWGRIDKPKTAAGQQEFIEDLKEGDDYEIS